jgi:hypothetical protein
VPAGCVSGRLGCAIRERVRAQGAYSFPTGRRGEMSSFVSHRSGGVSLADSFPDWLPDPDARVAFDD